MADKETPEYRFTPQPEAHAMAWGELLPPVRGAVAELLSRIEGATASRRCDAGNRDCPAPGVDTVNSFLVYGVRGTGKSTVLHSSKAAIQDANTFFKQTDGHPEDPFGPDRSDVQDKAEYLKRRVVWLDVMDLEPIPDKSNLLTGMLVRLQNALEKPGGGQTLRTAACYEEKEDSARRKLTKLINNSAMAWRNLKEPDTRSRAHREIAASEIHATFRDDFVDAVRKLGVELAQRRNIGDECLDIVLPVDNIDRSPTHLASIVKLAQLVACPNLWFVMAGDRQDVDTFLERAYWKELIRVGNAAGPKKPAPGGEDEAFVMARRQAAAASHRLLPPGHRIEVGLVQPRDTLCFRPAAGQLTMRTLFEKIAPAKEGKEDHNGKWFGPDISFLDFFELHKYVTGGAAETEGGSAHSGKHADSTACYSEAAKLALALPSRGVVNLWGLAWWIHSEKQHFLESSIEKIARTMLRTLLDESTVSSRLGRQILEQTIRRKSMGETILDFSSPNPKLHVAHATTAHFEQRTCRQAKDAALSTCSSLSVIQLKGVIMSLSKKEEPLPEDILPDDVAGWLAIYHDAILWSKDSLLFRSSPVTSPLVTVMHEVARGGGRTGRSEVRWPSPQWPSFLAHEVFEAKWDEWYKRLLPVAKRLRDAGIRKDWFLEMFSVAWIHCAVSTYMDLYGRRLGDKETEEKDKTFAAEVDKYLDESEPEAGCAEAEQKAVEMVRDTYALIGKANVQFKAKTGGTFMRDWIERKLPLLLSYSYVPIDHEGMRNHRRNVLLESAGTALTEAWTEQQWFVSHDIRAELAKLFPAEEGAEGGAGVTGLDEAALPHLFQEDLNELLKPKG